jgi:mono/diheme cytochrome c family protein
MATIYTHKPFYTILSGVLLAVGLLNGTTAQAQTSTFTEVYSIFQAKCATCHSSTALAGNLNLTGTESEVYNAIVEQNPSNAMALSKGQQRIDKGYPYRSFLLRKIGNGLLHANDGGTLHTDEGQAMPPYGSTPLTNVEIETVRQWILAGAPQTGAVVNINTLQSYYSEGGLPLMQRPEPPNPQEGFQIHLGPIFLAPETEQEYNIKYDLGNDTPLEVKRLDCKMGDQSHHFLLYKFATPADALETPDGLNLVTLGGFAVNSIFASANRPLVAAWQDNDDMRLPAGTAFKWSENTVLDLNYHIPNYGIAVAPVDMYLNVYTQPNGTAIKEMKTDLMQYEGSVPAWTEDLSGDEFSQLLYPIAESFLSTSPDALEAQLLDQGWPSLLVDGIINLIEGGTDANGLADFIGGTIATLMDLGVISSNDINLNIYSLMLQPNTPNQVFTSNRINGNQWNIWYVTSHTHKFGWDYDVYTLDGNNNIANQIFEGTINGAYDWSHPPINYYEPLIELPAGHGVKHQATYNNFSDDYVTFGLTTNEEMFLTFIQYTEGENIPFVGIPNIQSAYCLGSPALTFMPNGGTLSGNGTQDGQFIPALAGVGTHNVTYSYLYNGQNIVAEYDIQVVDVANPTISNANGMLSAPFGYENYQWLLNGAPIDGATGINYTPVASGEYTVAVSQLGCTLVSEPTSISVGIENSLAQRVAFAAYPNPLQTQTILSYGLPQAAQVKVDLYDVVGKKISTLFDAQAPAGLNTHRLNTQQLGLTQGVYFARITINGETATLKLIQQ